MEQQARNMTMEEWGCLKGCRYLLHDRDAKFCQSFRELIMGAVRCRERLGGLLKHYEREAA